MNIQQQFDRERYLADSERLRKALRKKPEAVVSLDVGDTAWNPSNLDKPIYGPCTITYRDIRGTGEIIAVVERE